MAQKLTVKHGSPTENKKYIQKQIPLTRKETAALVKRIAALRAKAGEKAEAARDPKAKKLAESILKSLDAAEKELKQAARYTKSRASDYLKGNDDLIEVEERLKAAKDKRAKEEIEHELFVRANAFGPKFQEFYDNLWAARGPLRDTVDDAEKKLKALK